MMGSRVAQACQSTYKRLMPGSNEAEGFVPRGTKGKGRWKCGEEWVTPSVEERWHQGLSYTSACASGGGGGQGVSAGEGGGGGG